MDQLKTNDFWRIVEEKCPELFLTHEIGYEAKEWFNYLNQYQEDEDDIRESVAEEYQDEISELEEDKSELEDKIFDLENEIEKLQELLDENEIEYE